MLYFLGQNKGISLLKHSDVTGWCLHCHDVFLPPFCIRIVIKLCFPLKHKKLNKIIFLITTLQHCDTHFCLLSSHVYKAVVLARYGTWTSRVNVTGMYPLVRAIGFTSQIYIYKTNIKRRVAR